MTHVQENNLPPEEAESMGLVLVESDAALVLLAKA
jgi:hypothetical protein